MKAFRPTTLLKRDWRRFFLVNILNFLRTLIFKNTCERLLLSFKSTCSSRFYFYCFSTKKSQDKYHIRTNQLCCRLIIITKIACYGTILTTRNIRRKRKILFQKQSPRGVPRKRCSENMQQIYMRTPIPKSNFNKVAFSWEHLWMVTSALCWSLWEYHQSESYYSRTNKDVLRTQLNIKMEALEKQLTTWSYYTKKLSRELHLGFEWASDLGEKQL